ncbi:MAG: Crp/Fnr family transcriptional regulator, partial [Bacteroidota bacterium]
FFIFSKKIISENMNQNQHMDFSGFDLFKNLQEKDIQTIHSDLVFRVRMFKTGELIASRGDRIESLMILMSGTIQAEMQEPGANDLRIETIHPGRMVAPAFLFGKNNLIPVSISAAEACSLMYIHKNDLLDLFQKNQQVMLNFLDTLSGRGQFLAQKIHFLTFKNLKQKMAEYILTRSRDTYKSIELDMTQDELARLFGVARTSLIRAINALEEENIISLEKRIITIHDKNALNEILSA